MSNIINVKEERNVLSFDGEIFDIVGNSTNFYLKFELDDEWKTGAFVTVVFDLDGQLCYKELDEEYKCQIPPTNCSKILFCITTEPDSQTKLSSTILSLNVEKSGDTNLSNDSVYQNAHSNLLGLIKDLQTGVGVHVESAQKATTADSATYATTAGTSETQVSLTGDESISGAKNFTGTITHNSIIVPDATQISNPNILLNGDFVINQRDIGSGVYIREGKDIYTVDRWGLFGGNGKFAVKTRVLTGQDETTPTILAQYIEKANEILYGKTITVSATVDGVRYKKTTTIPSSFSTASYDEDLVIGPNFKMKLHGVRTKYTIGVQFVVENGVSITIRQVKLEVSDIETKYIERNYSEDLQLCQRYYQRFRVFSIGYGTSDTTLMFFVTLPATMRILGTLYFTANPSILINGEKVIPDSIKVTQIDTNGLVFIAKGTGFVENQGYMLMNGILRIDAEIY